jgi:ribosomal protein L11 methyltransferase
MIGGPGPAREPKRPPWSGSGPWGVNARYGRGLAKSPEPHENHGGPIPPISSDPPAEPHRPGPVPPTWLLLGVDLPARGQEHLLVEALRRIGAHAVEREGERAVALFPPPRELEPFLDEARSAIRAGIPGSNLSLTHRWEPRRAWARRWCAAHPPRTVGRRFVVLSVPDDVGGGDAGTVPPGSRGDGGGEGWEERLPLRLAPGVGFGTGEHATTRACLRLLEDQVRSGDRIADIGSGSGVLAVAAALLGAGRVEGFEMDPASAVLARRNGELNGVTDRIRIRILQVEPGTRLPGNPFHGIVANLEIPLLLPLLPALSKALIPGGWLISSGALQSEANLLRHRATRAGLLLRSGSVREGWWTGVFRRTGARPSPTGEAPERGTGGRG